MLCKVKGGLEGRDTRSRFFLSVFKHAAASEVGEQKIPTVPWERGWLVFFVLGRSADRSRRASGAEARASCLFDVHASTVEFSQSLAARPSVEFSIHAGLPKLSYDTQTPSVHALSMELTAPLADCVVLSFARLISTPTMQPSLPSPRHCATLPTCARDQPGPADSAEAAAIITSPQLCPSGSA